MRKLNPFYLLSAFLLAIIIGGTFTSCQAEPTVAQPYEQPTVEAESYFIDPEPYDPCKDMLEMKYGRGLESRQRQKQCEAKK